MATLMMFLFVIPAIEVVLLVLCGIDKLVFGCWLGKKDKRFKTFADYSVSWLSLSYRLPGKMKKNGMKYWWIGIPLMLVSPAALVTYTTVWVVQEEFFPFPLNEDAVPYKEHKDIVAITGLDDFPSFTYRGNSIEPGFMEHHTSIRFDFEKELSSEYIEKLKNLSDAEDNVYWSNEKDGSVEFHRAWDGEYIKSPVSNVRCEPYFAMTITKDGFTIKLSDVPTVFNLKEIADSKALSKNTGVTFPSYKLVNFYCQPGPPDSFGDYTLLLDKKPSKEFIKQLEKEWNKTDDGLYVCSYPTSDMYGVSITVDPDSRIIRAEYGQWIGHSGDKTLQE